MNGYLDLFGGLFINYATVGSISNLGTRDFEGTVFLRKRGTFSKVERAVLFCLLKNLGGMWPQWPQWPPVPTSMDAALKETRNSTQGPLLS